MLFKWHLPGQVTLEVKPGNKVNKGKTIAFGTEEKEEFVWDVAAESDLSYQQVEKIFGKLVGKTILKGDVIWQKKKFFLKSSYQLISPIKGVVKAVREGEVIIQPIGKKRLEYSLPFPVIVEGKHQSDIICRLQPEVEIKVEWLTDYLQDVLVKGVYHPQPKSLDRLAIEGRGVVVDGYSLELGLYLEALSAAGIVVNSKEVNNFSPSRLENSWVVRVKEKKLENYFDNYWMVINQDTLGLIK